VIEVPTEPVGGSGPGGPVRVEGSSNPLSERFVLSLSATTASSRFSSTGVHQRVGTPVTRRVADPGVPVGVPAPAGRRATLRTTGHAVTNYIYSTRYVHSTRSIHSTRLSPAARGLAALLTGAGTEEPE